MSGMGFAAARLARRCRDQTPESCRNQISTVNQCLDRPTRASAGWAAPTPADGVDAPFAGAVPAVEKGRVLVLEDDPEIAEIVRACLVEQGYAVVVKENGEDGVREILDSEFTMVFCDFMLPGLRGDAVFRAVEKISPELCPGFVFMTGHQDDEVKCNFIRSVNALVLWKPFPLKNLFDSIALVEVRRMFARMHGGWPACGEMPQCTPAADEFFPVGHPFHPPKMPAGKKARPEPGAARRWARPKALMLGGVALFLAGATLLEGSFASARNRATVAAQELAAREVEWAKVSTQLQEAAAVRPKIARDLDMRARLMADRARPRWTPGLHAVALAAGESIHLLELQGWAEANDPATWTVRIRGAVAGAQARLTADRFRMAVEEHLKRSAGQRPVSARLEKIAEEPGALNGPPQTAFVLVARVGAVEAAPAVRKGKR